MHIGNFNYQFIGVSQSKILKTEEIIKLEALCGCKIIGRRLLYRASEQGFESTAFHRKCDFVPNTLTLIQTQNGCVFGGFTSKVWEGNSVHKEDASAYIFSFKNKRNIREKMAINRAKCVDAIYCDPDCGPCFGKSGEIHIANLSNQGEESFSKFNGTYWSLTSNAKDFLADDTNFKVAEIEVYAINELTMSYSR